MAITLETTINRYIGLSTDTKPTHALYLAGTITADPRIGSTFFEYDTKVMWKTYDGTNWAVYDAASDVGVQIFTSSASSTTTLTCAALADVAGQYVGQMAVPLQGAMAGEGRYITAYNGTNLITVSPAWAADPGAASAGIVEFAIISAALGYTAAEVQTSSVAAGGGSVATTTRLGLLMRWLADLANEAPNGLAAITTDLEPKSIAAGAGAITTLTRAGLIVRWIGDNLNTLIGYFGTFSRAFKTQWGTRWDSASDLGTDVGTLTTAANKALFRFVQSQAGAVQKNGVEEFCLSLYDITGGAIASGSINIAGISASMYKSSGGGAFSASGVTQPTFAKSNGIVYCAYQFVEAEWETGDMYELDISGITVTIGTDTLLVPRTLWSNLLTSQPFDQLIGVSYFVNNITGNDANTGLSWSQAVAQVNQAITLSEANRLGRAVNNQGIRNRIYIQGTGLAYAPVTALPNYTDVIGYGASPPGDGYGIVVISGAGTAPAAAGVQRGNTWKNIQFAAKDGYWCFDNTNMLRTVFDACAFMQLGVITTPAAGGLRVTANSGGNIIKNCLFGANTGYLDYGIYVSDNCNWNSCLIEHSTIGGQTAGIYFGNHVNDKFSVIRDNVIGDMGGGCTTGIYINNSDNCQVEIANNSITATTLIVRGAGATRQNGNNPALEAGGNLVAVKTQTDKLASAALVVGASASTNWNTGTGTSTEAGADLVTIGGAGVKQKLVKLLINVALVTTGSVVEVRAYDSANAVAGKRLAYSQVRQTPARGTPPDIIDIIAQTGGAIELDNAMRIEFYSSANEAKVLNYEYRLELR